jgi:hypothetical protein
MSLLSKSLAKGIIPSILNLLIATNIVYSEDDQQKEKTPDKISITATRIERDTLDIPASVDIAGAGTRQSLLWVLLVPYGQWKSRIPHCGTGDGNQVWRWKLPLLSGVRRYRSGRVVDPLPRKIF